MSSATTNIPTTLSTPKPTKKPLYEASTQFRNWRYSPEQLLAIRTSLNYAAVAAIRNTFETQEPGCSSLVSFLTPDEEHILVKLYISKVTQLCGLFRFPEEVEATAVSYLKRFYLKNTVMDWHPKNVMLTALFLATKTTNLPISLETYTTRIPNTTPSDVLDLEFLVAQSLGFEFAVWHSHRALWGIWLDLQSLPNCSPSTREVYDKALGHVRASRLTDAELIYTPSQIALAAISLVVPELALQWSASKLTLVSSSSLLSADTLPVVIDGIKSLITSAGHPPDLEAVREVDRRLKLCKNPEKVVGSSAYVAKQAEEAKKAEEKRNRKAVEVSQTIQEDLFGNELGTSRPGYDNDDDD